MSATAAPRLPGVVGWPPELAERYRRNGWWGTESLGELLDGWAERSGDALAVCDATRSLSYAELAARSRRLAGGLAELGLRADDRVVVQLPNRVAFVELLFALLRLGALPVMALPAHRAHEIGHLVELAEAVAYAGPVADGGFDHLALARELRERHGSLEHLIAAGDDVPADAHGLDALAERGPETELPAPHPEGVALFLLSGGTTGLPKLIPRTHADYAYNARASAELCRFGPDTRYLAALPVSHNFPLACPGVLGALAAGGSAHLTEDPRPDAAFARIAREGITATALVPALTMRWTASPLVAEHDLSSLELVQVGGARLGPEAARRVEPVLGARLQQVFGMAEGLLNYTRLDDPDDVICETQGRPLCPDDEVRVVDAAGAPVAPGEVGELETRGPYTLHGYYRAEEHNRRAFSPDGFYRSGDIVRMRPSGDLEVAGRAKDMINRGGEKISAEELEDLMIDHPLIDAVAAVAMPDPELGERTCAVVVAVDGATLELADVCDHLRAQGIATFKLPERLERVAALPVTKVGKIDKAALRDTVAAALAREQADG